MVFLRKRGGIKRVSMSPFFKQMIWQIWSVGKLVSGRIKISLLGGCQRTLPVELYLDWVDFFPIWVEKPRMLRSNSKALTLVSLRRVWLGFSLVHIKDLKGFGKSVPWCRCMPFLEKTESRSSRPPLLCPAKSIVLMLFLYCPSIISIISYLPVSFIQFHQVSSFISLMPNSDTLCWSVWQWVWEIWSSKPEVQGFSTSPGRKKHLNLHRVKELSSHITSWFHIVRSHRLISSWN